jgi:hypothetical protein
MQKPKVLHTIFLTSSQDLKRQIEEIPELSQVLNYKLILLKFVKFYQCKQTPFYSNFQLKRLVRVHKL